jgi:hypothetical protein
LVAPGQRLLLLAVIAQLGNGFTVILKVIGVPGQLTPPTVLIGVTVIKPEIGEFPILVAVKAIGFEVPLEPNPMAGLLFVHENEVTLVPERGIDTA